MAAAVTRVLRRNPNGNHLSRSDLSQRSHPISPAEGKSQPSLWTLRRSENPFTDPAASHPCTRSPLGGFAEPSEPRPAFTHFALTLLWQCCEMLYSLCKNESSP
ncbi:hypothetical protein AVEN_90004-1 [Araneus ventricosus]|uniref:Uncharacterized protein n=1 Tax=Araneus ventricosus TaxID=182803 RepID=A0A4Y2DCG9_ARAVE|nr:hypothetical protein AVEN_90004-1 [Araneus ventricosus]